MNRNIVLFLICIIFFFILSVIVIDKSNNYYLNNLLRYDEAILVAISQLSLIMPSYFNQFMVNLTIYGRDFFWPVVIVVLFLFGCKEGKKTALAMAITMLLLIPLVSMSKEFIDRPRPSVFELETITPTPDSYSFPSGHAAYVSAGAAIALLLFGGTRRRTMISVCLAIEAFLVSFSRIYVGDHYPLDVLGGVLLGAGLSFLVVNFVDPIYRIKFLNLKK